MVNAIKVKPESEATLEKTARLTINALNCDTPFVRFSTGWQSVLKQLLRTKGK